MLFSSTDSEYRRNSIGRQLITGLLLAALLFVAFPAASFSADRKQAREGLVYCPLSRKLQPIRSLEVKKERKAFDYLCASTKTKDYLFQEIVLKNPWRVFTLNAASIENLVFEYLSYGEAALEGFPEVPKAPFENLSKRVFSTVAVNNRSEHKLVWKNLAALASPNLSPRPPTNSESPSFSAKPIYQSPEISRRMAPRAPPLFS
ncbi:MAG TPA: hypothetical protein VF604_14070 [Pyrinomonadaceae bacterium]